MKFIADFFPILLFFGAYHLYDIYVATAVAVVAAFVQVGYQYLRHHQVPTMHWVTLGLLVVFGGLTLLLRDPTFIKWKPTVVNWLFAAAFLVAPLVTSRTLIERLMSHAVTLPDFAWRRLNVAWIIFFFVLGALNLFVAYRFEETVWVNFKLFGLMGLTLLFAVAQGFYLVRHMPANATQED